jgi:hypothetical protein
MNPSIYFAFWQKKDVFQELFMYIGLNSLSLVEKSLLTLSLDTLDNATGICL